MRKNRWFIFFLLIMALVMMIPAGTSEASTLKAGYSNGDVWDLQFRLNILGYLPKEELDGVYGSVTVDAVRRFQQHYGLPADGIAGEETWKVLKKVSVNQKELDILAHMIHGEARGESYVGQVAIGAVIMNRVQSSDFPDTVAGVAFEPQAFTAVDDGQYWLTPNSTAYKAAIDAVRGWDPTHGCLFYFNPDTATSAWIWSRPQKAKIGKHIFAM